MGSFSELVKNFDKTRNYIRDFFIYGFKVRSDFERKSSRTYDDEKRRIESWLSDYIKHDNSERGKQVSISLDSGSISENPLYKAYYSKSFTANDIKLHFFIIDVLSDGTSMTVNEITDKIYELYNELFETQTIRIKLREYAEEGIIIIRKKGKIYYYSLIPDRTDEFLKNYQGLADAVKFFSETQKFGVIGNSILKSAGIENDIFVTKHNYIVHTLEDIIIPEILDAIENKKYISVVNFRNKNKKIENIIPLQIMSSLQTGRRYLAIYVDNHFTSMRLDFTEKVISGKVCDYYDDIYDKFLNYRKYCFSASFGLWKKPCEIETITIDFIIDEKNENYVIERLEREKGNGILEKIEDNHFRLTVKTFDSNELIPWIRTFTGRILSLNSDNKAVTRRFYNDVCRMKNIIYKDENYENIS
ncbi:MAG: WYL domain-containing protein [Ruminococcus sp.]|nr:WYL domain-containing protein [Ruminococcus sp.]